MLCTEVKEISSGSQKSCLPFTLYQSVSFLRQGLKCLEKCCGVHEMVMLQVLTEKMLLAWSFSSHLRIFVLVNALTLNLFLSFTDNRGDVLVGCIWLGGSLAFHNFCNFCGNQWFLLKRLVCHNDNSFYNLCCSNARRVIIRLGTLCQALRRHGVDTLQLNSASWNWEPLLHTQQERRELQRQLGLAILPVNPIFSINTTVTMREVGLRTPGGVTILLELQLKQHRCEML